MLGEASPASQSWRRTLVILIAGFFLSTAGFAQGVIISEFAAAPSGRLLRWSEDDVASLGTGTSWTEPAFDDSTWSQAAAPLGYNKGGLGTVTEPLEHELSIYMRKEFILTAEEASSVTDLVLDVRYDDAILVFLNGREVARRNLGTPGGFVYHDQSCYFALDRTETIQLPSPVELNLEPGTNVLAIQTHTLKHTEVDTELGDQDDLLIDARLSFRGQTENFPIDFSATWTYFRGASEPSGGLKDEDGDFEDWIEIFNQGDADVSLDGWALTDNPGRPEKWLFPEITLGSGEYLVVFASGKNRRPTDGSSLHTSFKLNKKGEYLALLDSSGQVVSEFDPGFPRQLPFYSYGRSAAGADFRYFDTPTPGQPHAEGRAFSGIVAAPVLNVPQGFHAAPFALTMATQTPAAIIRYTNDGSVPTLSDGEIYSDAISIGGDSIIRARAFKDGMIDSATVTRTYLIDEHPDRRTLPALFIVGDNERDLFAPHGIMAQRGGAGDPWRPRDERFDYNNFTGHGRSFERPVSIAFVEPSDNSSREIEAGVRVHGSAFIRSLYVVTDDWRQFNHKVFLRLYFRNAYGGDLNFPLFRSTRLEDPHALVLRGGHTDLDPLLLTQDEFARQILLDAGHVESHGTFVNLYLNGQYRGPFNVVERLNEEFFQEHYQSDEEWDVLKTHEQNVPRRPGGNWFNQFMEATDGDLVEWNALNSFVRDNDMTDCAKYQNVQPRVDLVNYIDYLLLNIYGANGDWPGHNFVVARERSPEGRFRFYSWDAERIIHGTSINKNTFTSNLNRDGHITTIYNRLRVSDEFKLLFADRIQALFFGNGAFSTRNLFTRFSEMADIMETPVTHFYGSPGFERSALNNWEPARKDRVLAHASAEGFWPGLRAPEIAQEDSTVITRPGSRGTIYFTSDGSDPREKCSGAVSPNATAYSGPIPFADSFHIKARVLDGSEWSPLSEADHKIVAGGIIITEYFADPDGRSTNREWFEVFNTTDQAIDIDGWVIADNGRDVHTITSPTPVLVPPRGHLVLGESTRAELNGGVPVDYAYGDDITLGNTSDEIVLLKEGQVVHSVGYGIYNSVGYSIVTNAGPAVREGTASGMALNYCIGAVERWRPQSTVFGALGETGTPGADNDSVRTCDPNQFVPTEPAFLRISDTDELTVRLAWDLPGGIPGLDWDAVELERDGVLIRTLNASRTSHTDRSLTEGGTYCYRVYTSLEEVRSPPSNEACAEVMLMVDPTPRITEILNNEGPPGTVFQVVGENFERPGLTLILCSKIASATLREDLKTLDVTAPECDLDGILPLTVITAEGLAIEPMGFNYLPAGGPRFLSGDCNGSQDIDVSDAVASLLFQFGGVGVPCAAACDVDGVDGINLADASYTLNFLFNAGPPPPAPYPSCSSADPAECAEATCEN